MSSEARHHHYIPQGYLRGFAHKRGKHHYVHVHDLDDSRAYLANVRNVCGERDFLRVEVEGHAPNTVEHAMAAFEAKCIDAIRRVAASARFEGEDANLTLNLMAMLAVRSPEMRENMRDFRERVSRKIMGLLLESKERYEGQMAEMRAAGIPVNESVTYEAMVDFFNRGEFIVSVRREAHMRTEFKTMSAVLAELGRRRWRIYTTDQARGEFVTTNRPVTLVFDDPRRSGYGLDSPGFSLADTSVYFPLTRHAMLVGRWNQGGPAEVAEQSFVAAVNHLMIRHSLGNVFSSDPNTVYFDHNLKLCRDAELIRHFGSLPTPP